MNHDALSRDGNSVVLFAVNDTLQPITRALDFSAFERAGDNGRDMTVWSLGDSKIAGEPDVTNSFAEPTRIAVKESLKVGPAVRAKVDFGFPPLSLTVIKWQPARTAGVVD